ncbi:MAG: C2 family cysteine protease [Candidatus Sericytochromatia bacterium]
MEALRPQSHGQPLPTESASPILPTASGGGLRSPKSLAEGPASEQPPPPLRADQLSAPTARSPIQAVLSLWQDAPLAVTEADKQGALALLERTRKGYHPNIEEMGAYHRVAKASPDLPNVDTLAETVPAMQNIFARLDRDKSGFLSDAEIKAARLNPSYKGREAVALTTLLKLNKSIQKLSLNEWKQQSGTHAKDLAALGRRAAKDEPSKWTLYVESYVFNQGIKLRQIDQRLFPQGVTSIRPDHIQQGEYGTCTLLAAAAAMAANPAGKQALFEMISEKPDGSFVVNFPGEKPVAVKRPTDAELILHASSGPDGLWLSVLEKAFVKRMESQMQGKSEEEVEKAVNSGYYLSEGIRLLTGNKAQDGSIPGTPLPQLRSFVAQTVSENRILLVTLNPDSAQAKEKALKEKTKRNEEIYADGLVGLHAYSVIGFDPSTDTITLRNPWNHTELLGKNGKAADGVDDGVFSVKLADFQKLFSDIAWQTRERA